MKPRPADMIGGVHSDNSMTISDETIARAPRRVEGRDKVTGRVRYAGDLAAATVGDDMELAVAITSTQATGRIQSIDTKAALASPGVRIVVTHANAPRLKSVISVTGSEIGDLLPLQDDVIHYAGQCVAIVIADTLENARAAAPLVQIRYSASVADAAFTLQQGMTRVHDAKKVGGGDPGQVVTGEPEKLYASCTHRIDQTFETPPHHHNAMEPGAIVASFRKDGGLTVQLPTQFSYGDAMILGQAFGFGLKDRLPRIVAQIIGGFEFDNKVRVISTISGGAFGGKSGNVHLLLAPMAAKLTGRPVKLVLTRPQVFSLMPFRGESKQRMRLAANADGKLQSIIQDAVMSQGIGGSFVEAAGEIVPKLYACENIRVHTQTARLDINAPGWMRAPGACIGSFAIESSMDMLAHQLGMDPLDFRLINYAEKEPDTGHEWSSKALKACYREGADRIGWYARNAGIGAMREGRHLVGFGMATSIYPVRQLPAVARVMLHGDGCAVVQTATHEIGQGTITAMTQLAAQTLGLPLHHVKLEFGDTQLPYGGMTVGSMTTLSSGAAIHEACESVRNSLLKRAVRDKASPLHQQKRENLQVLDGRITAHGNSGTLADDSVAGVMSRHPDGQIEAEAVTGRDLGRSKYGRHTFGAQFAKVLVDPDTMHVQVSRLVGAFAGGRIINPLLVRSQLLGAMIWGIGQAMMEESSVDQRSGTWMNRNLGEALVPTNADVERVEAIIVEEDDTRGHALGIKGMGEIGVIGTAAAIGNAIFHATGIRLTKLPFRIDRLLEAV